MRHGDELTINDNVAYKVLLTVEPDCRTRCEVLVNPDYVHLWYKHGLTLPPPETYTKRVQLKINQKRYKKDDAFKAYLEIGQRIQARLKAIHKADDRAEFVIDESLFDL